MVGEGMVHDGETLDDCWYLIDAEYANANYHIFCKKSDCPDDLVAGDLATCEIRKLRRLEGWQQGMPFGIFLRNASKYYGPGRCIGAGQMFAPAIQNFSNR